MNHFYEPNTNKGIWGFSSSKDWAQNSALQSIYIGMKGDQTWQKAIDLYAKGDEKSAFIALGHILHLLEDATVPAHTRLDAHPEGDPYEVWTKDTVQRNIDFNIQPMNVNNLSDAFYQLADYSNKYFLSKDTIDLGLVWGKKTFSKIVNGITADCIEGVDSANERFCFAAYKISKIGKIDYFVDDPIVHADYFNLLGPKAVSYGAGTIKLFLDEAEKKRQEQEQKNWWDKIKSWLNSQTSNLSGSLLSLFGSSDNPLASSGNNAGDKSAQDQSLQDAQANLNRLIYPQTGQNNSDNNNGGVISIQPLFAPQQGNSSTPYNNYTGQLGSGNNPSTSSENNFDGNQQITSQFYPPRQGNGNETEGDDFQDGNPSTSSGNNNLNSGSSNGSNNNGGNSNNSNNSNGGGNNSGSGSAEADIVMPETYATSTLFASNTAAATTTAVFDFSSSDANSNFQCSLDNATSSPCVSPQVYENLSEGAHNFQVQAIDLAGNQDPTPVIINWTIDTIQPIISNISATDITRNSAKINFITSEPTYAIISYGTTTVYNLQTSWTQATSTSHSILLSGLDFNTNYHFQISAKDSAGNIIISSDQNFKTSAIADHVVISEFAVNGAGGANDEWIELYNPTSSLVDLSGWSVQYRGGGSASFQKKNFAATSTIPSQGFFLITNNSYAGNTPADISHNSFQMSAAGGNIFLANDQRDLTSATSTSIIDKVAYGAGANLFPETIEFTPAPGSTQSLERKASASSTAESLSSGSEKWQGNGYDSDNNLNDFVLQLNPVQQNLQSLIEPRVSFPSLAGSAPWPMFQQNEAHQARMETGPATSTAHVLFSSSSINFTSPPVVGQDRIYAGATDGLYAFNLSGSQQWFYPVSGGIYSTPLISSDGTIYFTAQTKGLYAVAGNGVLKWHYSANSDNSASLNMDKNGIVYVNFGNSKLYAFYPDGSIKWIFDASAPPLNRIFGGEAAGSLAIDNIREKLYINIDGYLYALNFDGTLFWDFTSSVFTMQKTGSPAIGNDGVIYFAVKGWSIPDGGFYALNPNGSEKWFDPMGYEYTPYLSPAIGPDGTIYFSSHKYFNGTKSGLFAFDPRTGDNKWYILFGDFTLTSSPLVAGNVVYLTEGNILRAYSAGGDMLWAAEIGPAAYGGFGAADSNGNLYLSSAGTIYRIGN